MSFFENSLIRLSTLRVPLSGVSLVCSLSFHTAGLFWSVHMVSCLTLISPRLVQTVQEVNMDLLVDIVITWRCEVEPVGQQLTGLYVYTALSIEVLYIILLKTGHIFPSCSLPLPP